MDSSGCGPQNGRLGWERDLNVLIDRALALLHDLKRWLAFEAEPLFLSRISSQQDFEEDVKYPDILSGVLDCVAHTTLLAIDKILRSLCRGGLQSNLLLERSRQQQLKPTELLNNAETIEIWRQRATKAFDFVHTESTLAAKPLEFGLLQIQSGDFTRS